MFRKIKGWLRPKHLCKSKAFLHELHKDDTFTFHANHDIFFIVIGKNELFTKCRTADNNIIEPISDLEVFNINKDIV